MKKIGKSLLAGLLVLVMLCALCTGALAFDSPQPSVALARLFGGKPRETQAPVKETKDVLQRLDEAVDGEKSLFKIRKTEWEETGYEWSELYDVLFDRLGRTPETLHVDIRGVTITEYKQGSAQAYVDVDLSYLDQYPKDLYQVMMDTVAQGMLAKVPEDASDWETARILHDELIRHVSYESNPFDQTAFGALVNGKATCNGYSMAYEYLLTKAGIACDTVVGFTDWQNALKDSTNFFIDDAVGHAWNIVTLTDEQGKQVDAYVDVTWDDPDMKDAQGNDYVLYDWFCVSQEVMDGEGRMQISHIDGMDRWDLTDVSMSYFAHEGYLIEKYNYKQIVSIFREQMKKEKNVLCLGMAEETVYDQTVKKLIDSNGLQKMLRELGLKQVSYKLSEDDPTGNGIWYLYLFLNPPQA